MSAVLETAFKSNKKKDILEEVVIRGNQHLMLNKPKTNQLDLGSGFNFIGKTENKKNWVNYKKTPFVILFSAQFLYKIAPIWKQNKSKNMIYI